MHTRRSRSRRRLHASRESGFRTIAGSPVHSFIIVSSRAKRATRLRSGPLRDFRTGTGGAHAPLSEVLPSARVARFVGMTQKNDGAGIANDPCNLTPNPSHSGKGNQNGWGNIFPRGME